MEGVPTDLISMYTGATACEFQRKNHGLWASLAMAVGEDNFKYIYIVWAIVRQYGYDTLSDDFAPCGYHCKLTGNSTKKDVKQGTK